ncbi:MCE family protein [Tomitella gaofuii]|uniref:MCE family protein n=1 Tax=Tomitella gaofuii TaxID=2760083 RepID=UPI0015F94544|nr:MCE family protein [Tomitella gaofuii]
MAVLNRVSNKLVALIAVFLVLLAVAGTAVWFVFFRAEPTRITAYFDRTVGIYAGSKVMVLGVEVGKVDSVDPEGSDVKVVMTVDGDVDIPAGVTAVQVTPSVVPDRYVQLAPAYSGGPKLPQNATLDRDHTRTPVEIDEMYKSIQEVSEALGPHGANKNGALTDFVNSAAANLDGNGDSINETIAKLSDAARTLSDSRGDIFATVRNLQTFASTLAEHDAQVRKFNSQMAQFNDFLDGERGDMAESIKQLSYALGDVARFVHDNKDLLESNIKGLASVTQTVASHRDGLKESLALMPLAIANFINAYDPDSGTIQMRLGFPMLQDPLYEIGCQMLNMGKMGPGIPEYEALEKKMRPVMDQCKAIADKITAGIDAPRLNLPFGILRGDEMQQAPVPGTEPGVVSPRFEGGN